MQATRIKEKRLTLIKEFLTKLQRRRFAKTFKRFKEIRSQHLDLETEANALTEQEIKDKDLYRFNYYANNEPPDFVL